MEVNDARKQLLSHVTLVFKYLYSTEQPDNACGIFCISKGNIIKTDLIERIKLNKILAIGLCFANPCHQCAGSISQAIKPAIEQIEETYLPTHFH